MPADFPNYHDSRGALSINFAAGKLDELEETSKTTLVIAHGLMLIVTWIFVAPVGVMIKRFGHSTSWGTKKIFSRPLPYVLHLSVMWTAILVSIPAVYLAKFDFGTKRTVAHGISGQVVFGLAVLQTLPTAFTPDKVQQPGRRRIWRRLHVYTGRFTGSLGVVVVMLGNMNYGIYYDEGGAVAFWILTCVGLTLITGSAIVLHMKINVYGKVKEPKELERPAEPIGATSN